MNSRREHAADPARRAFLTSAASGLGGLALTAALSGDCVLAGPIERGTDPLIPHAPHFAPKAKSCIFIFMEGAPSQADLFDPKPKLNELHGQKLPDSLIKNVRFAFLKKDTATILGTKRKFE